jgi:hypothetical protein
MTLVVGSCPACPRVLRIGLPLLLESELRLQDPAATMTGVGRFGRDDLLRRKSCISPLQNSSSESKLPALPREEPTVWHGPAGLREAAAVGSELVAVSPLKSESLARGGVMTTTSVGILGDDPLLWRCV